ncbi:MAG: hypothetical protein LBG74_06885 [Spirochaetaceae bacterium]|jgi:hypothetical protein|nr:hypothetical protein [Spirochaetaceae bacterium]
MGLVALNNVIRKDSPIYYRHLYTGIAVVEVAGRRREARIDFVVETNPWGARATTVDILESIDYPALVLQKELKNAIEYLDFQNKLPHQ